MADFGGLIIYDGICNFCNSTVEFLIKRDHKRLFRYSYSQSELVRSLLEKGVIDTADIASSIVYIKDKIIHTKSEAVIFILQGLGRSYSIISKLLKIIPRQNRDWFYVQFAKRRYYVSGRNVTCKMHHNISELFLTEINDVSSKLVPNY